MENIDKQLLKKEYAIKTVFTSFFASTNIFDSDVSVKMYDSMMRDSDIKSAIKSIKMAVLKRKLKIVSKTGKNADDINNVFNGVVSYDNIDALIDSKFTGYQVLEIMYNDSFLATKLMRKPREWFSTVWDDVEKAWKWVFSPTGISLNGNVLPYGKFLVCVNEYLDTAPTGQPELYSLVKYWKIKNNALNYANDIVEKYGGVITWFVYNEDTSSEELQEMVDGLANVKNGSIIPIPGKPNSPQQGLGKEFGFINTADLTSDIHQKLIEFCKNQITEYILGNALIQRQGETGSYAASQTANNIREEYVESYASYITTNLNELLVYYSNIHGKDVSDYAFVLVNEEDVNNKEDLSSKKLENYKKIKELGYSVSKEYISKETGIPIEYLEESISVPSIAQFEKKIIRKKELFRARVQKNWKAIVNKTEQLAGEVSKIVYNKLSTVTEKSLTETPTFNLGASDLDEQLIISYLKGMFDVLDENNTTIEFETFNGIKFDSVFDMPFEEAIAYLGEKFPQIYDTIAGVTKKVNDNLSDIDSMVSKYVVDNFYSAITTNIEQGKTFKDFKENIDKELKKLGLNESGYYYKTMYRTSMMFAYNGGRHEQQLKNINNTPYWLYDAVDDERTSDVCSALNGKIFKATDPIWQTIYPPLHPNCRSGVIALDEDEYKDAIKAGEEFVENPGANEDIMTAANNVSEGFKVKL